MTLEQKEGIIARHFEGAAIYAVGINKDMALRHIERHILCYRRALDDIMRLSVLPDDRKGKLILPARRY